MICEVCKILNILDCCGIPDLELQDDSLVVSMDCRALVPRARNDESCHAGGFWQVRRVNEVNPARPAKEFDTSEFFAKQKRTSEKIPSCQ